jgi:hypothetical protein
MGRSAPVLRIGTLVLAVLAACDFSLCIGATGSHVPYKSLVWRSNTFIFIRGAKASSALSTSLGRRGRAKIRERPHTPAPE